jgi:hypothetical protein
LRWWVKNFKDQEKATNDEDFPDRMSLEEKLSALVSVAESAECDLTGIRKGYFSTNILEYADAYSSKILSPYLIWQICSGFAHGRPWASLGMNDMERQSTDDDGVSLIRLTSDHKRILTVTLPAMHLMEDLLRLFQTHSKAPSE